MLKKKKKYKVRPYYMAPHEYEYDSLEELRELMLDYIDGSERCCNRVGMTHGWEQVKYAKDKIKSINTKAEAQAEIDRHAGEGYWGNLMFYCKVWCVAILQHPATEKYTLLED